MGCAQPRWTTAVLLLLVALLTGCSRQYYLRRADQEVDLIIAEKSLDPRWGLPNFSIRMDPRSRYFDPYESEAPPMPQDDAASHRYMHYVDGKEHWPHWDEYGVRPTLENVGWREQLPAYVPMTADGEVQLSMEIALELALIHSPSYQNQLETLYLSALDVSAERFRFDTQFFGSSDTTFTHLGGERSGLGERNTLQQDTSFQMRRRLATAGELLVGFANSFVWQFAGPNTGSTLSIVNFSLVQPLLRGAGRDVALEQLTIVERGLLANLRAFQRYRQGFFTDIAIGQGNVAGPQRRGGFFGGTGLTGFTGQGAGGFGGVGGATGFGRAGFGGAGGGGGGAAAGFAGGGAGAVGGFVGLLQQLQEIRNTRASLEAQLRTLSLLEAYLTAGVIDLTQVDQFRQNIETERAQLLQTENSLQSQLDSYKTGTLGLPPDLPLALDDTLIRQFQFIDPRITTLQDAVIAFQDQLGEIAEPSPAELDNVLQQANQLLRQVGGHFAAIEQDLEGMVQGIEQRTDHMTPVERRLLEQDEQQLYVQLREQRERFQRIADQLQQISSLRATEAPRAVMDRLVIWTRTLLALAQEISLVQARARLEAVVLEPLELQSELAYAIALRNRYDLMNNRADLVDTWRLIQFNADALQSNLDIVFSGDIQTLGGDNPVAFRAPTGTLRAALQFDAPFTRLLERNNFRQVLIDYQRDRRQFIQFHDQIHQTLRELLRSLNELRLNLEIQRRAVAIAIRRVDLTREVLNEPVPPPEPGQPVAQFGPTAALNLLTALSDLRSTQNNFMSVWLNYYAARMLLMRELGIMELDERGFWIDQPVDFAQYAAGPAQAIPPDVPPEWLEMLEHPPVHPAPEDLPGPLPLTPQ